ncbi:MAG TPA: phosphoribosylanthranilate isomerase [Acidimicrobiales bacterium]
MSAFVKICGITSEEDALLAVAMGADAIGFILAPSPRQVRPGLVADIVKRLPPEILTIGVFRDESATRVAEVVNATGLVGAQLHGREPPSVVKQVAQSVRFVTKAFPAGSPAVRDALSYGADCILVDAPNPGSGRLFDWSLTGEVPGGVRLMLAGGLTPENVADAVRAVQPWAVDVATGVEGPTGRKDAVKLRAFVANAKAVPLERDARAQASGEQPYDWRIDT